jgi:tetratricopeptide (TPR) repeat protein
VGAGRLSPGQGDFSAGPFLSRGSVRCRPSRTAQCVHNLAHVLQIQDELDRARTLFERAMAIFEAQLGMDHPSTIHILANLGELLINLGDPDQARSLFQRALALYGSTADPPLGSIANVLPTSAGFGRPRGHRPRLDPARARPGHSRDPPWTWPPNDRMKPH